MGIKKWICSSQENVSSQNHPYLDKKNEYIRTDDVLAELDKHQYDFDQVGVILALDYDLIQQAITYGMGIYLLDENVFLPRTKRIERFGYLLKSCKTEVHFYLTLTKFCEELTKKYFKYGESVLIKNSEKFIPKLTLNGLSAIEIFEEQIHTCINSGRKNTEKFVCIQPDERIQMKGIDRYDAEFIHSVMELKNKIVVLNDRPGSGKTLQGTKKIIEECISNDRFVVTVTGKQMLANAINDNEDDYHTLARSDEETKSKIKSLAAVVNTLYSGKFREQNGRISVLIIEEIEDLMSHMISEAAGQQVEDRARLLKSFLEHCKKAELIIVADAMCSTLSINVLIEQTGYDAIVYKQTDIVHTPKQLLVYEENLLHQKITKTLNEPGKNAIIFSDASQKKNNNKFSQIGCIYAKEIKPLMISSDYFEQNKINKKQWLQDIDNNISQLPLVVVSPVINVGISIKEDFDVVSVMSYGTLSPVQIIQMSQRVRVANQICISMTGVRFTPTLGRDGLLWAMIARDKGQQDVNIRQHEQIYTNGLDRERQQLLINNPYVQILLDRAVHEAELRSNYNNNILWIAEILGYEVIWDDSFDTVNASKEVVELNRMNQHDDIKRLVNDILTATKLTEIEAGRLNSRSNITDKQYAELQAYEIRSRISVELTEEIILIWLGSKTNTLMNNYYNMINRVNGDRNHDKTRSLIINEIIEIIGFKDLKFDIEITASQLNAAASFIETREINVGHNKFNVIELVKADCPQCKNKELKPRSLLKYFLDGMLGLKLIDTKQRERQSHRSDGKRDKLYKLEQNDNVILILRHLKYPENVKMKYN